MRALIERIKQNIPEYRAYDEAATRNSIILPILSKLGWDIFPETVSILNILSVPKGSTIPCAFWDRIVSSSRRSAAMSIWPAIKNNC